MNRISQQFCGLVLLLCIILATPLQAKVQNYVYEHLYTDLPFDMPRVERPAFPKREVLLSNYAKADNRVKCTKQFQRAIDDLAANGGGKLIVPSGFWYTGPIVLKSNINLHLEKGSLIFFSQDTRDFPIIETTYEGESARRAQNPISAVNAENIAITGYGIIDGNGEYWRPLKREKVTASQWERITSRGGTFKRDNLWQPDDEELPRPIMVNFYKCRNILLEGVTFQNSPAWNIHPECCENVIIDGIDIRNPSYAQNGDGLDLESCKNCIVAGTTFDVGDDAICIKSGKNEYGIKRGIPTENVIISGCTVYAAHGGLVIGSEMSGGVRNIKCSDCQFIGTDIGLRFKSCRGRGGIVERIWVENIAMAGILADAIRFNLYYGGKSAMEQLADGTTRPPQIEPEPVSIKTPLFRNIHIKNISCQGAAKAIYFNGLPEMPVKDISLEDVQITAKEAGELIYCDNIRMKNVDIAASNGKPLKQFYCNRIAISSPTVSACFDTQNLRLELAAMEAMLLDSVKPWNVPNRVMKVERFGAKSDGRTVNTLAIQRAIDRCSELGGGVVLFSKGDYVTGTIELKTGVILEVSKGARILGSTSIDDYPERIEAFKSVMSENYAFRQSLIYAERAHHVGIHGEGEIYFRGEREHFSSPETTSAIDGRPLGIRMIECDHIWLKDIFLHNSASWMQNYLYCRNLLFDGIRVLNQANFNNDGLDPDGCVNVVVRNCHINAEDDAMCLKGASARPTENVLIENSTFVTTCNAFKIGTDTQGDFRRVWVRNVKLGGVPLDETSFRGNQASTGITIASVDGGTVEDILIENAEIDRSRCPIFIRIGNRGRVMHEQPKPNIGNVHRICIENVRGKDNFLQGSFISGIYNHPVEHIAIRDVRLECEGGGTQDLSLQNVPENEAGYPDAHKFNKLGLPSYGFFLRHARNMMLENIEILPQQPDARPEIFNGGNCSNVRYNNHLIK